MSVFDEPVEVVISDNELAPDPAPEGSVSSNVPSVSGDLVEVGEDEEEYTEHIPDYHVSTYYYTDDRPVTVSVNNEIDPEDLISVNSVSLNVLSADGLSLNSISVNVSNNYISNNTIQLISFNEVPFWHKPFNSYTAGEGLLFVILVTMVIGFVSSHLLRGLKNVHF